VVIDVMLLVNAGKILYRSRYKVRFLDGYYVFIISLMIVFTSVSIFTSSYFIGKLFVSNVILGSILQFHSELFGLDHTSLGYLSVSYFFP
jgi:hypothetical protein